MIVCMVKRLKGGDLLRRFNPETRRLSTKQVFVDWTGLWLIWWLRLGLVAAEVVWHLCCSCREPRMWRQDLTRGSIKLRFQC
jgi:hypothetical protein